MPGENLPAARTDPQLTGFGLRSGFNLQIEPDLAAAVQLLDNNASTRHFGYVYLVRSGVFIRRQRQ